MGVVLCDKTNDGMCCPMAFLQPTVDNYREKNAFYFLGQTLLVPTYVQPSKAFVSLMWQVYIDASHDGNSLKTAAMVLYTESQIDHFLKHSNYIPPQTYWGKMKGP